MAQRSPQKLIELFQSKAAVEFSEIRDALDGASRTTTYRYLEKVPYRSSYNKNGRYYTLHDSAKYDRWGLYSVGDIHFSIDGTLKATVVRLVRISEEGRTQRELQDLLRVRVQLFLTTALHEGELDREQLDRLYVYLHTDPEIRAAQLGRRQKLLDKAGIEQLELDDETTIRVLLVLLRYPGSGPGDVVQRLKGREPPVSRTQVDHIFSRYGLGEKKGPPIF